MRNDLTICSDQALLGEFVSGPPAGREPAFAELVNRHAPMVMSTCRRLIGTNADADDAAQAVFLTLAHKARDLGGHPTLAGWLHRVARNVSVRQRDALAARRRHEATQEARAMQSSGHGQERPRHDELREVLDAGLDKLSERYRLPLVLHYLEGRSQDEVGVLLNVPSGTLASLLSRGRELLREQLGRQGVAVGALGLSAWLTTNGPLSGVPGGFAASTASAATALAAGRATVIAGATPQAAALTTSTVAAMAHSKLITIAAAAMLALGSLGVLPLVQRHSPAAPTQLTPLEAVQAGQAPQPVASAASVAEPDDGAPAALWAVVHALRANDLVQLHLLGSPAQQAERERAWKLGSGWAWGDAAVTDQILGLVASDAGQRQVLPFAQALVGHLPIAQWVHDTTARVQAEPPPSDAPGTPTNDVAHAQRQTLEGLLTAFSGWLPRAGLDDPGHAAQAAKCLLTGLAALHISHSADLAHLDLPEALRRCGLLTAQFKLACAAYGLQIDQVLDSVHIIPSPPQEAGSAERILNVAFTAFDRLFMMPVTLAQSDGHWRVMPAAGGGPAKPARPGTLASPEF